MLGMRTFVVRKFIVADSKKIVYNHQQWHRAWLERVQRLLYAAAYIVSKILKSAEIVASRGNEEVTEKLSA